MMLSLTSYLPHGTFRGTRLDALVEHRPDYVLGLADHGHFVLDAEAAAVVQALRAGSEPVPTLALDSVLTTGRYEGLTVAAAIEASADWVEGAVDAHVIELDADARDTLDEAIARTV